MLALALLAKQIISFDQALTLILLGILLELVLGKMVSGTCEKMCFEDGGAGISGEGR
jgi:hypothetical protein